MKKNQLSITLFLVFLLPSCVGAAKENTDDTQKKSDVEIVQIKNENFDRFLDDFNTNRIFQLERIVFPITVMTPDVDRIALAPTEEIIEKMDWELLDLTYDSTYTTRDFDRYTQTINFRKDTAHVALRGIDNGIFADYYFKLIEGEWYLVTLVE
ncbi:MAG: DUF4348 domain-containing protein [Bacteroidia bacterium]|nr:DUF4348 domain-containing protein [Bacteroidia bacterium]